MGLDTWTACGESMGVLGRELGRSGYAGTAAPAWPGLPGRSEKLGKDVTPVGCRPTGLPAAAIARHRRRAPWLSQAMVLRRHPCRGAASLARFSFPGRER